MAQIGPMASDPNGSAATASRVLRVDDAPADQTAADDEKPWWDDPSLPWRHQPTRADLACWGWIAVVGVYTIALLPLRAILIGWSPPAAAMITGGRASVVATGAWVRVNGGPLVVYWLVSAVSLVKFSWVYWWAGRLWGTNIVDLLAGQSARAKRRADRAVRLTNRFSLLAIFLTFLPIPFPMPIVFAAIGAAGQAPAAAPGGPDDATPPGLPPARRSLIRFLIPVVAVSLVFQAGYLALGWWIGHPAVEVVDLYAKYMWYVTLAIVVVMLATWWWRRRRTTASPPEGQPPSH